jgi:hypothetical protein
LAHALGDRLLLLLFGVLEFIEQLLNGAVILLQQRDRVARRIACCFGSGSCHGWLLYS